MTFSQPCRVYWGSHGCSQPRGHEGLHECDCCTCPDHLAYSGVRWDDQGEAPRHAPAPGQDEEDSWLCVCTYPYYGPKTHFFGDDSPTVATGAV